jgi:hypothetical protein
VSLPKSFYGSTLQLPPEEFFELPETKVQQSSENPTYDELTDLALKICKVIIEPPMAGSQVAVTPDKVNAAKVLMFHIGRGFRTFQAIGLLLANGYSQDGTVLARVLLEVLFEMAFIAKHPQDAELYLKYGEEMEKQWEGEAQRYDPWSSTPLSDSTKPRPKGSWHPRFKSVRQRGIEGGIHPVYYVLQFGIAVRRSRLWRLVARINKVSIGRRPRKLLSRFVGTQSRDVYRVWLHG